MYGATLQLRQKESRAVQPNINSKEGLSDAAMKAEQILEFFKMMERRSPIDFRSQKNGRDYQIEFKVYDPEDSKVKVRVEYLFGRTNIGHSEMWIDLTQGTNAAIKSEGTVIDAGYHQGAGLKTWLNEILHKEFKGVWFESSIDNHSSLLGIHRLLSQKLRDDPLFEPMQKINSKYGDIQRTTGEFLDITDKITIKKNIYNAYQKGIVLNSDELSTVGPVGSLGRTLGPYQEILPTPVTVGTQGTAIDIKHFVLIGEQQKDGQEKEGGKILPADAAMKTVESELIEKIKEFQESAYTEIHMAYPEPSTKEDIHTKNACAYATLIFRSYLKQMNIQSILIRYDMEKKRSYDLSFHEFIIVFFKGHLWVVDPTWQQVLPEYTQLHNEKPKVMVAEIEQLKQVLENLDVPTKFKRIWEEAVKQNQQEINDFKTEDRNTTSESRESSAAQRNPNSKAGSADAAMKAKANPVKASDVQINVKRELVAGKFDLRDYIPAGEAIEQMVLVADNTGTLTASAETPVSGDILGGISEFLSRDENFLVLNSGDTMEVIRNNSQAPVFKIAQENGKRNYFVTTNGGAQVMLPNTEGAFKQSSFVKDWPVSIRGQMAQKWLESFYKQIKRRQGPLEQLLKKVSDAELDAMLQERIGKIKELERSGQWGVHNDDKYFFSFNLLPDDVLQSKGEILGGHGIVTDDGTKVSVVFHYNAGVIYSDEFFQTVLKNTFEAFKVRYPYLKNAWGNGEKIAYMDLLQITKADAVMKILNEHVFPRLDPKKKTLIGIIGDSGNDLDTLQLTFPQHPNVVILPVFLSSKETYVSQLDMNRPIWIGKESLEGGNEVIRFMNQISGKKSQETPVLDLHQWKDKAMNASGVAQEQVLLRSWVYAPLKEVDTIRYALGYVYHHHASFLMEMLGNAQNPDYVMSNYIMENLDENIKKILFDNKIMKPLARQVLLSAVRYDSTGARGYMGIRLSSPYTQYPIPAPIVDLRAPLSAADEESIKLTAIPRIEEVMHKKNFKNGIIVVESLPTLGKLALGKYIQKHGISGFFPKDVLWLDLDKYVNPLTFKDGFFRTEDGDDLFDMGWGGPAMNKYQFKSDVVWGEREGKKVIVITGVSIDRLFKGAFLPYPSIRIVLRPSEEIMKSHLETDWPKASSSEIVELLSQGSKGWEDLPVDLYLDVGQTNKEGLSASGDFNLTEPEVQTMHNRMLEMMLNNLAVNGPEKLMIEPTNPNVLLRFFKGHKVLNVGPESQEVTGSLLSVDGLLLEENIMTRLRRLGVDAYALSPQQPRPQWKQWFIRGVVQNIPVPDNTYDDIVSMMLFDPKYFEDSYSDEPSYYSQIESERRLVVGKIRNEYAIVARELRRVLKDGGIFFNDSKRINEMLIEELQKVGFEYIRSSNSSAGVFINHKGKDAAQTSTVKNGRAMSVAEQKNPSRTGGIDLNPAEMSMQVKQGTQDFKFNFNGTEIDAVQVIGATFTIRTLTPVTDLAAVLGAPISNK